MTHGEAQREMLVEKYLLGELDGRVRDQFEDHLFDCMICAEEVKTGFALTEGIRASGPRLVTVAANPAPADPIRPRRENTGPGWFSWLRNPWVTGAAFAGCLLLLCIQSFVLEPRLRGQLAAAHAPAVLNELILTGSATRGGAVREVSAREHGTFLLSVDIPTDPRFGSYRCVLISPAGKAYWSTDLSPAQVNDTVAIEVPVEATAPGLNALKVEGIPRDEANAAAVPLLQHRFVLKLTE